MPLIFAENEITESGISYADKTGERYQYPKRLYKNIIMPGERFIYYRGRRTAKSTRTPQIYFGAGVVGDIYEDPADPRRLVCDILDYYPFESPVPFKFGKNDYLEIGGKRKGYYQRGVRRVTENEFQRILILASAASTSMDAKKAKPPARGHSYASPEIARLVDEYAISEAENHLKSEYPNCEVQVMAKNNPGFDIKITGHNTDLFIEVKGTQRLTPQFFISDGELRFSKENANRYLLLVIYGIDFKKQSHQLFSKAGAITELNFDLSPTQWAVTAKL